jgi:hypothetical protein
LDTDLFPEGIAAWLAFIEDFAGRWLDDILNDLHCRSLACPIWPKETETDARSDLKGNIPDCLIGTIMFTETVNLEDGLHEVKVELIRILPNGDPCQLAPLREKEESVQEILAYFGLPGKDQRRGNGN